MLLFTAILTVRKDEKWLNSLSNFISLIFVDSLYNATKTSCV